MMFASVEMSGKSVRSVGHFLNSSPLAGANMMFASTLFPQTEKPPFEKMFKKL